MKGVLAATGILLAASALAQISPAPLPDCNKNHPVNCLDSTTIGTGSVATVTSIPQPYSSITFGSGITIDTKTGAVHIPPGLPLDKAAKQFYNMLAVVSGTPRPFPKEDP
jgi:hypothetical protein